MAQGRVEIRPAMVRVVVASRRQHWEVPLPPRKSKRHLLKTRLDFLGRPRKGLLSPRASSVSNVLFVFVIVNLASSVTVVQLALLVRVLPALRTSPVPQTTIPREVLTLTSPLSPSSLSPRNGTQIPPVRRSPPLNANKPLPPPPPPSTSEEANGFSPRPVPVLKLERIMATLRQNDIEKLFSGAPQYFARSEGHYTGAPHPSVAFPWDEALEIRDLRDHVQIEDSSWSCVTAWPHVTRDANRSAAAGLKEKKRPHFYPRCRERPNMLSMEGLEKGTMGYQAGLELAVADALQEEKKIDVDEDSGASRARLIFEKRQKMLSSKDGLRCLEESAILDQLIKNYDRYTSNRINNNISSTLYNELFLGILHPPTRVVDHEDPYSLTVQIQALLNVLATPHLWLDFSQVEWRIRLGQILWGSYHRDGLAEIELPDDEMDDDFWGKEERYWLLFQILLACELLIRLDAITEGEELGMESIKPAEIRRFEKDATPAVRWSMHLARAWLENIQVVETEVDLAAPSPERNHLSGWLASLAGRMVPKHSQSHQPQTEKTTVYTIQGRHPQRQVDGLTHFARKLRWPEVETYAARISDNVGRASKATPINTPVDEFPHNTKEGRDSSSYFGGARADADVTTQPSRRRKITASLHPSGWLSKSYLSGLMLPGEGLQHFIMSTLLENDSDAMEKLGPTANLYGGFVYCGKSFWSTACIVGRVLAAGKGSAECMGWISSDIVPQGHSDGWVDIIVDELPEDMDKTGKNARLWAKADIEKESAVLGDADPLSVLPADFIIPFENTYRQPPPSLDVQVQSLNLFAPVNSVHTTPTEEHAPTPFSDVSRVSQTHTYPSSISFSVISSAGKTQEYTFALSKDVYFVTAHPCAPSAHVRVIKSPSSPTIQQIDVTGTGAPGKAFSSATITGHPLHKYFTYTVIHLSELLQKQATSTLDDLLMATDSTVRRPSLTPAASLNTPPRVLVIDCITSLKMPPQSAHDAPSSPSSPVSERHGCLSMETANLHLESRRRQFGSDMEIIVRALCAEKGWNAIISRRRRGCLACAIREAGALGWKVIIRVD
ncbi:hypothetical protein ACRALDRAFT_2052074 [Sodiomyces alcalophilus JCM 7366]|uniref:uncharacterized protein n=1 Tax=Sodiomyces alcalophilus JCM 7366 TaxID=591952 RepID=UPI0039B42C6D